MSGEAWGPTTSMQQDTGWNDLDEGKRGLRGKKVLLQLHKKMTSEWSGGSPGANLWAETIQVERTSFRKGRMVMLLWPIYLGLGMVDGGSQTEAARSKTKDMGFQEAARFSYCLPIPLTQKSSAQILLSREQCSDCLTRSAWTQAGVWGSGNTVLVGFIVEEFSVGGANESGNIF